MRLTTEQKVEFCSEIAKILDCALLFEVTREFLDTTYSNPKGSLYNSVFLVELTNYAKELVRKAQSKFDKPHQADRVKLCVEALIKIEKVYEYYKAIIVERQFQEVTVELNDLKKQLADLKKQLNVHEVQADSSPSFFPKQI